MRTLAHFEAYVDFLSTVLLCAPDSFPRREWLADAEQMNLERAFATLRENFKLVEERINSSSINEEALAIIDAAFEAYRRGDEHSGARAVQALERLLIANGRRARPVK